MNQPQTKRQTIISHNVQNISDLLNSLDYEIEESHKELCDSKQRLNNSLVEIDRLTTENLQLKEKLRNTKPSNLTTEQLNKLVNDKIIDIMNNPLNYLMELPMVQRNDFVAKLIKTVIG